MTSDIEGYSEMLEEEAQELEQDSLLPDLKRINQAGQHLLTLITGVLDLSKVEAGLMDVFVEDFDLNKEVGEVLGVVHPLMKKNSNRLESQIAPGLGVMRADTTKVRQILINLLSNAAKFTSDGVVQLVTDSYRDVGEEWIRFKIVDSGIGMTTEQVKRVFIEFTQADSSISREYEGTGLGLTISKQFCLLMGGDITVESAPEKGSVFTVCLPRDTEKYVPAEMLSSN